MISELAPPPERVRKVPLDRDDREHRAIRQVLLDAVADGTVDRFEIAHGKAYGALALGVGSRALMERAETQAYFITAATAALGGRLIPVPGGVLVRGDDRAIQGAVGISGDSSDNDETAASKAIQAAGLTAQVA